MFFWQSQKNVEKNPFKIENKNQFFGILYQNKSSWKVRLALYQVKQSDQWGKFSMWFFSCEFQFL